MLRRPKHTHRDTQTWVTKVSIKRHHRGSHSGVRERNKDANITLYRYAQTSRRVLWFSQGGTCDRSQALYAIVDNLSFIRVIKAELVDAKLDALFHSGKGEDSFPLAQYVIKDHLEFVACVLGRRSRRMFRTSKRRAYGERW